MSAVLVRSSLARLPACFPLALSPALSLITHSGMAPLCHERMKSPSRDMSIPPCTTTHCCPTTRIYCVLYVQYRMLTYKLTLAFSLSLPNLSCPPAARYVHARTYVPAYVHAGDYTTHTSASCSRRPDRTEWNRGEPIPLLGGPGTAGGGGRASDNDERRWEVK